MAFGDKTVYRGREGLAVFDGNTVRTARTKALDLTVADGALYVLDERQIWKTRDLRSWTDVVATPADATSIGVLDGVLYIGTAHSELYRYCDPSRPLDLPPRAAAEPRPHHARGARGSNG